MDKTKEAFAEYKDVVTVCEVIADGKKRILNAAAKLLRQRAALTAKQRCGELSGSASTGDRGQRFLRGLCD